MNNHVPPAYDVIVIGAGSVGAPTAFALAQQGFRVLVLDPAPSLGQGSNKHAIGGIRASHSDPAKIRLCRRSIEVFSTWKERYGEDIDWVQGGYVFVAYREPEERALRGLLRDQQSHGLDIRWLDAPQLLALVPSLTSHNLLGGSYSPGDGSASPLLACHAFYEHARRLGVRFHFNEPVIAIHTHGDRVSAVETPLNRYAADVVINAAGAWASAVGALTGEQLPIRPDAHEAGITEPVQPFLSPMVVDLQPQPGSANFYFYQHHTGQIIFCLTPAPNIWGFETGETSAFLPQAAQRLISVMPRLGNIRVRRTWRGLYPMTPDGLPIVGWSAKTRGLLLAVGLCGQGFMLGPGLGELLARMAAGTIDDADQAILNAFSPERSFSAQEQLK